MRFLALFPISCLLSELSSSCLLDSVLFKKEIKQHVVWLLFIIFFFFLEKAAQMATFQGNLMFLLPTN
jgi:hypothetical protein